MNPKYRPYYPRWHRKRVPVFWWLRKRSYAAFICRELTSIFVAYSAIMLVLLVLAMDRGDAAYGQMMDFLAIPVVVVAHVIVLLIVLFHTITWLNLAPMAIVVKLGDRKVPPAAILIGHYAAWLVSTVVVVWLLLWR